LKALVVTADDVGLHPGMTAGALAAHDGGAVTAVSVAVVGRAFEDAVPRLRERPALDVGVHLTLVGERPLSPPREVPSLLGRDGALLPGYRAFLRRYLCGGIAAAEIEAELRRQIERLLGTGLAVVHANSHQHLHVLPRIFAVVLRLAAEYRIPFVRLPQEPAAAGARSPRAAHLAILNRLGHRARGYGRRAEAAGASVPGVRGVRCVGPTIGLLDAGRLTLDRIRPSLAHVAGVTELVCHPGLGSAALAARYPWGYAWEDETAALRDPRLQGLLGAAGIELTSFSRLRGDETSP
jgi:predicted glycoside hydrolase/deacetylase ChbG (UPF0249 family)